VPVRTRLTVALALTALATGATACSPDSGSSDTGTSSAASAPATTGASSAVSTSASVAATTTAAASCTPATMKTRSAGVFTFGSDQPVYEPWYVKNTPTNGQGFESAVAYAVAAKLGYSKSQVKWTRVTFNAVIAPGPKKFDADLDEVSITDVRKKSIDFSSGYYDVAQAVIALKGSKAASVHTVAGLRGVKLGAQVGTTSYTAITDVIKPSQKPSVFNSNDDAKAALKNGQIGALVVDLPTAFYITSAQLDNGVIVGQLPVTSKPEQFGMVLDKGSSLTACVTQAVTALRRAGTLTKLADKWLLQQGAPKLS
jgi:polar amino acid transport system substrate-binding protein